MKVGIVHTSYLQKGGEDVMVEQEYQLLKGHQLPVSILYFKNATGRISQLTGFFSGIYNTGSSKVINNWITAEKPDVIHIHNWHYGASPSVIRAAKRRGIPVVHTLHNYRLLCPSGTLLSNNKLFLQSMYAAFPWAAVFKKVYRNSYLQTFWLAFTIWSHKVAGTWRSIDKYIVLTENAKSIFTRSNIHFTANQLVVKPNFIADIQAETRTRQQHFLFVGRLSEEKGIRTLLDAFAGAAYNLSIIGDGPLCDLVLSYGAKYANIKYLGFQDKAVILEELRNCTALLFSSIWYEGNPLTIIEALACGTPVIASRMGAMETMIEDGYNGLHFEAGDTNDLKDKTERWQTMPAEERDNFYANARASYLQRYTPEKNFDQLMKIYKSVTR